MAEKEKRNNAMGKVATPKATATNVSAAQSSVDTLDALGRAIGGRIKLMTTAPHSQSYEGTLFTACSILNVVAINTRPPPPNPSSNVSTQSGDYNIIPVSRIASFQIMSIDTTTNGSDGGIAKAQAPIGSVDPKRLKQREDERVRVLKEEEMGRGKGVTKEAQAIFDSFKRINMPIRWHNQEMIVHDAVIIAPPYRTEDCKGTKDKQEVLNRVKKVLDGERRKIKEKEGRNRKESAAGGLKKGG